MHSSNFKDITGQRYGRLIVERYSRTKGKSTLWICKCDCGKEVEVKGTKLRNGHTKSCGCYKLDKTAEIKTKDITGERFGMLTAVKLIGKNEKHQGMWECICDCGNHRIVPLPYLTSGDSTSCGCATRGKLHDIFTRHGESHTRLHNAWANMKYRCLNPNADCYENYGGRGITVCEEWINSYEAFRDWALSNGYTDDLTLDREDNNGNYEPDNCRWVTYTTQNNNRRDNVLYEVDGEVLTLEELSRKESKPTWVIQKEFSNNYLGKRGMQHGKRGSKDRA